MAVVFITKINSGHRQIHTAGRLCEHIQGEEGRVTGLLHVEAVECHGLLLTPAARNVPERSPYRASERARLF